MAGVVPLYPLATPHVAGDPIAWRVRINTPEDISAWTWAALVREHPTGPVVVRLTVDTDEEDDHQLILRAPEADSALISYGMAFDLRQNEPVDWTWLRFEVLNVVPSYSYEAAVI